MGSIEIEKEKIKEIKKEGLKNCFLILKNEELNYKFPEKYDHKKFCKWLTDTKYQQNKQSEKAKFDNLSDKFS